MTLSFMLFFYTSQNWLSYKTKQNKKVLWLLPNLSAKLSTKMIISIYLLAKNLDLNFKRQQQQQQQQIKTCMNIMGRKRKKISVNNWPIPSSS